MSVEVTGKYLGAKKVELVHGPSGEVLITEAPKDNGGEGKSFSPTDLVAAAYGSCVMTTIAMIAGMFPIAIGWGSDPSFRSPMAIAVMGGLLTSTVLSLLVIPAMFTYVDDLAVWLQRIRAKVMRSA